MQLLSRLHNGCRRAFGFHRVGILATPLGHNFSVSCQEDAFSRQIKRKGVRARAGRLTMGCTAQKAIIHSYGWRASVNFILAARGHKSARNRQCHIVRRGARASDMDFLDNSQTGSALMQPQSRQFSRRGPLPRR